MPISFNNIPKLVAYVRKPAESILSTRHITAPIQAQSLRYAGSKAQEQMPYVFKIHNNGLKRLYPQEISNINHAMSELENFRLKGLDSTANLNKQELQELYSHLWSNFDSKAFTLVSLGVRPAMATLHSPILSKIKSPNFDTVVCDYKDVIIDFVINKKAALENIHRNKDFYVQRFNLKKTASDEDIYKILTGENSPLKSRSSNDDVIGMIMGFPRKDNLIFQLERNAGIHPNLREDPQKYKEALLKELSSPNYIYSKFDDNFKKELEKAINSISNIKTGKNLGLPDQYAFVHYVDDTPEIVRINRKIREAMPKLEKINAANQKAKDDELIRCLTESDSQRELEEFMKSLQVESSKLQSSLNPQKVFEDFLKGVQAEIDKMQNPFN